MALLVALLALYLLGMAAWGHRAHRYFRRLDPHKIRREDFMKYRALLRLDYESVTYWKTVAGSVLLMSWRLPTFLFFVCSCLSTHALLSIGQKSSEKGGLRLHSTRDRIRDYSLRVHSRIGLLIFGVLRIKEQDEAKVLSSGKPMSIVSNHVSILDILFYLQGLIPSFVAKKSVRSHIIAGGVAVDIDCVFVNRESEQDRHRALRAITDRQSAIDEGKRSRSLLIFPEGTTSNGRFLIPFKKGAFTNLSPVVPVVLVYSCPYFQVSFEIVPIHYWLCLALSNMSPVTLDVFWLPPVAPPPATTSLCTLNVEHANEEKRRIEEFTLQVYREMGRVLDLHHPYQIPDSERIPCDKWEGSLRLKKEILAILAGDEYVRQLIDREDRTSGDETSRAE